MLAELIFVDGRKDEENGGDKNGLSLPFCTSKPAAGLRAHLLGAIPPPSGHYTNLNQITVPKNLPRTPQTQLNANTLFTGSNQTIFYFNICLPVLANQLALH